MRRIPSLIQIGLHGLLAVWMTAVAMAPLWHTGHAAPQVREEAAGHDHRPGAWLCDASPKIVEPGVECVLCKAQRHLSQYSTRTPGSYATLEATTATASPASLVPRAGEGASLAPRAPPLC